MTNEIISISVSISIQSVMHVTVDTSNITQSNIQYTVIKIINTVQSYIFEFNLLKPTGYVMHHQFNIQQFYALPTLYLCVLYLAVRLSIQVQVTSSGLDSM